MVKFTTQNQIYFCNDDEMKLFGHYDWRYINLNPFINEQNRPRANASKTITLSKTKT